MSSISRSFLCLIGLAGTTVLVGAPLVGWPRVVRLPAVLVPALLLAALVLRAWHWREAEWRACAAWVPSARTVWTGALVTALMLSWLVLTRFESGEINGVDFTVYFDRPCFQTVQGRPLFVETADFPEFSGRSGLAHHAYWIMFPICALYAIDATPLWLLALSVVSIVAGAVYVLRIMQHLGGGGVLATATALAFVFNDNTARTLNYGFHPEMLYAWFLPWLLDGGLKGHRRQFVAAAVATTLVKEDAVMPLFAASVALALHNPRALRHAAYVGLLLLPMALAMANLALYYALVVPGLTTEGVPAYAHFWASYGPTPMRALIEMAGDPGSVMHHMLSSGFFRVMSPHLFLPLLGWQWILGIMPMVLLYSAADDPQLHAFGIYYAIPLVPFLVVGASSGVLIRLGLLVPDVGRAALISGAVVLSGSLVVGSWDRGYTLRPWKTEIAAVPSAIRQLADEHVVLVQSGLYPHAGYDERIVLLTPDTLRNPRYAAAAILIAPGVGAYPFEREDLRPLDLFPRVRPMPGGLIAVRRPLHRHSADWRSQHEGRRSS